MEALQQLAQQQAAIEPGVQPGVNQNVQNPQGTAAQPIPAMGTEVPVNKLPDAIPYSRFSEVVHQKNELAARLQAYENMLQAQAQAPQRATYAEKLPPNATVDDLMGIVKSEITNELSRAYEQKVKPMEDYVNQNALLANVEGYYNRNPEAAKVRQHIDAYFDTLSPSYQSFVKDSVRRGDTTVIDNLYYTVANQVRANTQNLVQQNVQQNTYQATAPQNFRTIRSTQPSFGDKISNASQFGMQGNLGAADKAWEDVMKDVLKGAEGRA